MLQRCCWGLSGIEKKQNKVNNFDTCCFGYLYNFLPETFFAIVLLAVTIPQVDIRQIPIIKGDAKSISIGAASIIAKVTRDRLMVQYDEVFPGYGFASNKGYGSAAHIAALKELGPTPIHRRSFIKNFL